jgi:hypothetical protein
LLTTSASVNVIWLKWACIAALLCKKCSLLVTCRFSYLGHAEANDGSKWQVARTRLCGSSVKVFAGRRNRGMAQGRLNQVDRCATVQSVRSMGMAQPVARHFLLDPGPFRRLADDPPDLGFVQMPTLATAEHRIVVSGVVPKEHDGAPHGLRHQHRSGFAALAEDGDLPGRVPTLKIIPFQRTKFSDTETTRI